MSNPRAFGAREEPTHRTQGSRSPRGLFLAFEGIEGCGKSTQVARLAARLEERDRRVLVTREPGGTPVGEALRALLLDPANAGLDGLTELFILEASRRAHVRSIIRPALARGDIVIADRFADSSVAYQGGGRELGVALVEHLNALATDGLEPDLTFLLDLDPDAGLARVARRDRSSDRMEQERIEFHRRVRAAYLELGNRCASRYLILDGQLPADEIARQVLASIQPRL